MAYTQRGNPFPVTSCGRRRTLMMTDTPVEFNDDSPLEKRRKKSNEPRKTTKGKGRNFRTVKEGAGMTSKGVKAYRRKNPGSKLILIMCITTTEALHTVKTLIKDDVYECCEASMDKETVTSKLDRLQKYIQKINKKE